jgi:hypothetical protein
MSLVGVDPTRPYQRPSPRPECTDKEKTMVLRAALLAEAATIADGKLSMLSAGWSYIPAGAPFAVCGKIDIPWHQGSDWHKLRLELLDGDGQPVHAATEHGDEMPIVVDTPPFRPLIGTHVKPGTYLDWPFLVNVGPGAPLQPGTLYEWRIIIDGETQDGWALPFWTAPAPLADAA